MKTIDSIPTSKISRASKLVTTGAKVGVNYLKYYGDKLTKTEDEARLKLNESNAEDIYDSLKQLKGSALKVAQMLSMEKSILPQAYVEKFSLAQFSVPPLSPPLVIKTFKNYFGKLPNELYDSFNSTSVNAASIGQVHLAEKNGKKLFFTKKTKTIEACQELSKTPKNMSNGSKLAKKSQIFVRGVVELLDTVYM